MVFGFLVIPVVSSLLYLSTIIRNKRLEKSKLLAVMSGMSYQFFLAQLFLWNLTAKILNVFRVDGNMERIFTSFLLCVLLSFTVWRFYDKPIREMLKKRLL